jgi:phosphatase NudJ
MARPPIPTWHLTAVVVRKEDKFLLVHESTHGQKWYFPAGRVETGESFLEAAHRETAEEAGIPIEVLGIVRIEHTPRADSARLRVFFVARPAGDVPLKAEADEESLGAEWVRLEDLDRYPLRAPIVRDVLNHVAAGGAVYPVEIIQPEGAPFPR